MTKKQKNFEQTLLEYNNIIMLIEVGKYNKNKKQLIMQKEIQKINTLQKSAKSSRLNRYRESNIHKRQNKLFNNNQKMFYRSPRNN